jgi:LPPG:FO 2-phospho-L-lactate transferase
MKSKKPDNHRPSSTVHGLKVVALAGGVGGAKLVHGLAQILDPENLTVIVNTGDDFEHYGLYISPDLDTVCYTLAGLANPDTGWGRLDETWQAIENAKRLGGPDWFNLGDRDLGTHLERTRRLREGQSLSQITRDFCQAWDVRQAVLPMSDGAVRTIVETDEGELAFQEYFVHRRCEPKVKGFRFEGVEKAEAAPGTLEAIKAADAVVICPSNPWVSIDPILAVAGIRQAVEAKEVLAVSPIIGGKTVKGPAAKMYAELGIQPSALAVAEHYRGLLSGFVMDQIDSELADSIDIPTLTADTLMNHLTKRAQLARDVLHFIGRLNK